MVFDGESSHVPEGSILGPALFVLYINDLLDDVICDIAICANDTAFYFKYEQTSHLWQQLELAFELEYMLFYKQCFLSTQFSIA